MKLKKLLNYLNSMSTPAYILLKISLIISIILMTVALIVILLAANKGFDDYIYISTAKQLFAMPQSILLIGGIFSAIIEDISS